MIEEKPLTKPFALISFCISSSAFSADGSDHASGLPSKMFWKTSLPPMRSKRNSSHIMLVQRDCPPSENGAMPFSLNFGTRSMMSPHDCGGWAPIRSKTLLFQ